MSKHFAVHAKVVALCKGDVQKADRVYDELVRRYYNTLATFDGNYVEFDEQSQFKATEAFGGGGGGTLDNDFRALATGAAQYLSLVSDEKYVKKDDSAKFEELRQCYLKFHEQVTRGYSESSTGNENFKEKATQMLGLPLSDAMDLGTIVIMDVQVPFDVLKLLALEVKTLSLANRDLYNLEMDRRAHYTRPGALSYEATDLTFPHLYEAEIMSATLCMHPVFGLEALAAYILGYFIQPAPRYLDTGVPSLERGGNKWYSFEVDIQNCLYSPGAWQANLDRISDLHASLASALKKSQGNNYSGYAEVRDRLSEWLAISRMVTDSSLNKRQARLEWAAWRLRALSTTKDVQMFILNMWRQQTIGIVFAHGFAFIETAIQQTTRTVELTGSIDFNIQRVYMRHIMFHFYRECLVKKFDRKIASGPVWDITKNKTFLERYKKHCDNYEIEEDETLAPLSIVNAYRTYALGEDDSDRLVALDRAKKYAKLYAKFSKSTTGLDPFTDFDGVDPVYFNVEQFRPLFPASVWEDNTLECLASTLVLYLKALDCPDIMSSTATQNVGNDILQNWLAGTAVTGFSRTLSCIADLLETGSYWVSRSIKWVGRLLRDLLTRNGVKVDLLPGHEVFFLSVTALSSKPSFPEIGTRVDWCAEMEYYLIHHGVPYCHHDNSLLAMLPLVAKTNVLFVNGKVTRSEVSDAHAFWEHGQIWPALYKRLDLISAIYKDEIGKIVDIKPEKWAPGVVRRYLQQSLAQEQDEEMTAAMTLYFGMLGACLFANFSESLDSFESLVSDVRKWAFLHAAYKMPAFKPQTIMECRINEELLASESCKLTETEKADLKGTAAELIAELRAILGNSLADEESDSSVGKQRALMQKAATIVEQLDNNLAGGVSIQRGIVYAAFVGFEGRFAAVDRNELDEFVMLCASRPRIAHKWRQFMSGEITMFDFIVPEGWVQTNQSKTKLIWTLEEAQKYWTSVEYSHRVREADDGVSEISEPDSDSTYDL